MFKFVQSLAIFAFSNISGLVFKEDIPFPDDPADPNPILDKNIKALTIYVSVVGACGLCALASLFCFKFKQDEEKEEETVKDRLS